MAYEQIGDVPGQAGVLSDIGLVLRKRRRLDEARATFRRSLILWQEIEDSPEAEFGQARSLNNLGMALRDSATSPAQSSSSSAP